MIEPYKYSHYVKGGDAFDDGMGWCPKCRHIDGLFTVGRGEFGWCDKHKVVWCALWNYGMPMDNSDENLAIVDDRFSKYEDCTGFNALWEEVKYVENRIKVRRCRLDVSIRVAVRRQIQASLFKQTERWRPA